MPLRFYNSLTQKKEDFVPLKKGKVGIYVCGITAYDSCHLGHARAAVSFDLVVRTLRHKGFAVTYVRNYTDIDDKIIKRSQETNTPWNELTERYIKEYQEDMESMNVATPTHEPRATQFIPQMIELIQKLIKAGKAYPAGGDVYYSVRAFNDYGKLSHKKIDELESGARIEIGESKKDPLDFALWKAAKPNEPTWDSPWGKGRPGWHIECSVMSTALLGQPFDIHGGGRDLIFPHHENEIAQSEGACDQNFCRIFLHNGFVKINTEKMSKSLRNFKTIKEVIAEHGAEVARYFLMSAHYGSPIDFTPGNMQEAKSSVDRFYQLGERLEKLSPTKTAKKPAKLSALEQELAASLENLPGRFESAMDDDCNTAKAFGEIFETIRLWNKLLDAGDDNQAFLGWAKGKWNEEVAVFQDVLGIFNHNPAQYFESMRHLKAKTKEVDVKWIEAKLVERQQARKSKDFKKGDAIRGELLNLGVEIKDRPDGTTEWHFR